MITDAFNTFALGESVAAAAGTALIGDVMDLGAADMRLGDGQPIYLVIQCSTSIITAGSAGTIKFALASDAQAAIATDGSATVHFETPTFVTDGDDANALDAGAMIAMVAVPASSISTYERYLGILATIATTTVTAGAINAFLTTDPHGWDARTTATNPAP